MVQPPASAAPTPIVMPPPALRRMVPESGTRQRNSPASFAAMNEPSRIPSTSITDQSTRVTSPVVRKEIGRASCREEGRSGWRGDEEEERGVGAGGTQGGGR